jgi:hypothetical protein
VNEGKRKLRLPHWQNTTADCEFAVPKQPKIFGNFPRDSKTPKIGVPPEIMDSPSWRVGRIDFGGPLVSHCDGKGHFAEGSSGVKT